MSKQELTLKQIGGIIGVIGILILVFSFVIGAITIEDFFLKFAESQIPSIVGIIIFFAGFGLIGAIIILILIKFLPKIMNYNLLNLEKYFYHYLFIYFYFL